MFIADQLRSHFSLRIDARHLSRCHCDYFKTSQRAGTPVPGEDPRDGNQSRLAYALDFDTPGLDWSNAAAVTALKMKLMPLIRTQLKVLSSLSAANSCLRSRSPLRTLRVRALTCQLCDCVRHAFCDMWVNSRPPRALRPLRWVRSRATRRRQFICANS